MKSRICTCTKPQCLWTYMQTDRQTHWKTDGRTEVRDRTITSAVMNKHVKKNSFPSFGRGHCLFDLNVIWLTCIYLLWSRCVTFIINCVFRGSRTNANGELYSTTVVSWQFTDIMKFLYVGKLDLTTQKTMSKYMYILVIWYAKRTFLNFRCKDHFFLNSCWCNSLFSKFLATNNCQFIVGEQRNIGKCSIKLFINTVNKNSFCCIFKQGKYARGKKAKQNNEMVNTSYGLLHVIYNVYDAS